MCGLWSARRVVQGVRPPRLSRPRVACSTYALLAALAAVSCWGSCGALARGGGVRPRPGSDGDGDRPVIGRRVRFLGSRPARRAGRRAPRPRPFGVSRLRRVRRPRVRVPLRYMYFDVIRRAAFLNSPPDAFGPAAAFPFASVVNDCDVIYIYVFVGFGLDLRFTITT